jgi:hypothetical protein
MHLLNAHLVELPRILNDSVSFELSAEFLPLCTSVHTLNAHLEELSEPSTILVFPFKLSTEFFFSTSCMHSMPTWQSSYRILSDSVCNCVLIHNIASKVFNNLEVFLFLSC